MRRVPVMFIALSALVAGAVPGGQASADELVVMPYACSPSAGGPLMRPAQQVGHRVIGRREQRVFRACSAANPGMCRQWTVHRFDFDCGGTPMPWINAVAAAEAGQGDVWLQEGRLHLRMPLDWGMAPDDPCAAMPYPPQRWRQRGLARHCADRAANMPPPVVEFPPGFAPVFSLDPIFVPAPPAQGEQRPPVETSAAPPRSIEPPPTAAVPEPAPKVAAAKEPAPPAKKMVESTEPPAAKTAEPPPKTVAAKEPTPPAPVPAKRPAASETATASPSAPAGTPVAPRIINKDWASAPETGAQAEPKTAPPPPTSGKVASGNEAARTFAESRIKTETGIVTSSTNKTEAATAAPSTPAASPEAGTTQFSVVMISVGLALLLAAIGFTILRAHRREHAELTAMTARDFGSVPLGSRPDHAAPNIVPVPATPRAAPARGAHLMSRLAPRSGNGAALVGSGQMPETREEALQVLGMGLAGDTGLTAVKKVVDGLRMSWHPDYAVDHSDRAAREQRMKQINAAWEILNGSRAA